MSQGRKSTLRNTYLKRASEAFLLECRPDHQLSHTLRGDGDELAGNQRDPLLHTHVRLVGPDWEVVGVELERFLLLPDDGLIVEEQDRSVSCLEAVESLLSLLHLLGRKHGGHCRILE